MPTPPHIEISPSMDTIQRTSHWFKAAVLCLLAGAPAVQAAGTCAAYGEGQQVGTIEDVTLDEASGLAASHLNEGIFWTHNDSGNPPDVYAIGSDGSLLATYSVTDASAVDWEDIELGPCPDGCACLFIADFGDNLNARTNHIIYRVAEPVIAEGGTETQQVTALVFNYPEGKPNAETLLVDPRSGDIYVVTKEDDGISTVYKFPTPDPDGSVILEAVATLDMQSTAGSSLLATGGDVSSDGGRVIIRTLTHAFEWTIPDGAPLEDAFATTPLEIPLPSASQGEAIAYEVDGMALLTVSENVPSPVHRITCDDGTPISDPVREVALFCTDSGGGCTARWPGQSPSGGGALGFASLFMLGGWFIRRRDRV